MYKNWLRNDGNDSLVINVDLETDRCWFEIRTGMRDCTIHGNVKTSDSPFASETKLTHSSGDITVRSISWFAFAVDLQALMVSHFVFTHEVRSDEDFFASEGLQKILDGAGWVPSGLAKLI